VIEVDQAQGELRQGAVTATPPAAVSGGHDQYGRRASTDHLHPADGVRRRGVVAAVSSGPRRRGPSACHVSRVDQPLDGWRPSRGGGGAGETDPQLRDHDGSQAHHRTEGPQHFRRRLGLHFSSD